MALAGRCDSAMQVALHDHAWLLPAQQVERDLRAVRIQQLRRVEPALQQGWRDHRHSFAMPAQRGGDPDQCPLDVRPAASRRQRIDGDRHPPRQRDRRMCVLEHLVDRRRAPVRCRRHRLRRTRRAIRRRAAPAAVARGPRPAVARRWQGLALALPGSRATPSAAARSPRHRRRPPAAAGRRSASGQRSRVRARPDRPSARRSVRRRPTSPAASRRSRPVVIRSTAAQSHHSQRAMSVTALSGSSRRNSPVIDSSSSSACTMSLVDRLRRLWVGLHGRDIGQQRARLRARDDCRGAERGIGRWRTSPWSPARATGQDTTAGIRAQAHASGRAASAGVACERAPAACSARTARDNRAAHSPGSRRAMSAIAAKARCARVSCAALQRTDRRVKLVAHGPAPGLNRLHTTRHFEATKEGPEKGRILIHLVHPMTGDP